MAEQDNLLIDTCLLAGRILIESGSEMYRVEDTILHIAKSAGLSRSVIFTTPTGVFFGIKGKLVEMRPINQRTINLEKVQRVNTASRQFEKKEINLVMLHEQLERIDAHTEFFPFGWQVLASAVVSATMMILFSGQYDWADFFITGVVGAVGYMVVYTINDRTKIKFISEFTAAFVVGLGAWLATQLHIGQSMDNIIIGGIMPLVPGVLLTTSIRDLLVGHLLTGIVRGIEALLTAFAIASGIGIVFRFFM